jgi:flagella basal body P-ring formation protein FlgA
MTGLLTPNSLLTPNPFPEGPAHRAQPFMSVRAEDLCHTPFHTGRSIGLDDSSRVTDLPRKPRRRDYTRSSEGRVRGLWPVSAVLLLSTLLAATVAGACTTDSKSAALEEMVVAAIQQFVASTIPAADAEIRISLVGNIQTSGLPTGELKVTVGQKTRPANLRRMLILMEVSNAEGEKRSFWALAEGHATARVVRALRPLKYGAALAEGDIQEEMVEIRDINARHCRSAFEIGGFVLRRNIGTGDPLTWDDLSKPILVRSGERVTLKAASVAMQLSTQARAEQNGRLGDVIRVRNLSSARIVNAKVVGVGEVRVN